MSVGLDILRGGRKKIFQSPTFCSGVLLYFMLTGGMPFRAENVSKLKKCILEGTYIIPPYISEDAASLIRAILIGWFPSFIYIFWFEANQKQIFVRLRVFSEFLV